MKVAITGANGFLATHFRQALHQAGHQTVSLVRRLGALRDSDRPIGLDSSSEITQAISGCDAVAHCAGIACERGGNTFAHVHVEGTRNVLAACRQAKISKVLLTSFLRARPNCGSAYHESKWEAEQLVRGSGLNYTIFKAGLIYGPNDQMTTRLGAVLQRLPFFAALGWKNPLVRPVAVNDMVALMVASLEDPRLKEKTVAVVGPETLGLNEMVIRLGRSRGVEPKIIPLPIILHQVMGLLLERLTVSPLITTAQVQMLREGLAEATQPFVSLPDDLAPQTAFSPTPVY